MKKRIDLDQWHRKEHFNFFSKFDEPFFGVTVNVDCTQTYDACEGTDDSFFSKISACIAHRC
ncbi:MAG: CatA-like O-acetyltransferase [Bacteroidota bacterium]